MGGVLAAPLVTASIGMAAEMIIDAFVIVIIGGMGSFSGSLLGAVLVAFVQVFGEYYLPTMPGLICDRVAAKIMCRCLGCCFRTGRERPVSGLRRLGTKSSQTCMGVFLSSGFLVCAGSLFGAERPFLVL
jgi:ABC-type branched-subunit amino acid transport system permease subunit